jgi:Predicted membrane protein (DUF2142)
MSLTRRVLGALVRKRAVLLVFAVALLNGAAWSLLTPPFQVPDETAHFAYAQRLAESGLRPGDPGRPEFSSEQTATMRAIGTFGIIGRPLIHPPSTPAASRAARAEIASATRVASRNDGGGPSTATSQPPLYYALLAVPYRLSSNGSLLARLAAMRLASAVIFAFGAAMCALFVEELLPRSPVACVVGGLAVALSPYTAFISSGVNPDSLLLTTSAATLLLVARVIRRGANVRLLAAIVIAVGAGTLTKLTYLSFIPPTLIVAGAVVCRDRSDLLREVREHKRTSAGAVAIALLLPAVLEVWLLATGRSLRAASTGTPSLAPAAVKPANARELISYAWQLFFPRPAFMSDQFGFAAPEHLWVDGFAGRYGWLDYSAPVRAVRGFKFAIVVVAALALISLGAAYRRVLARRFEVVAYSFFAASLAVIIAKAGYDYHRATGFVFEQPRYLFPLAGFYATVIGLACRGLGRRATPLVGLLLVTIMCLHDLSGLFASLARYYG